MYYVHPSVEDLRLPEEYPRRARPELLIHPLDPLEEHHLHLAAPVRHPYAHSLNGIELHASAIALNSRLLTSVCRCPRTLLCTGTSALRCPVPQLLRHALPARRRASIQDHTHNPRTDLHKRHVRPRISHPHKRTPVDIPERENPQQLTDRAHLQLLPQQLGPLRPHSRKKLHLHI